MKYTFYLILLPLIILFLSCRNEEDTPFVPNDEIEMTAAIGDSHTRVSQTSDNRYVFDPGDTVQIVGWTGAFESYPTPWESSSSEKWWISSLNVFNGHKWVATPYMRWQNGEGLQHHFIAWWPAHLAGANDNLRCISHTVTPTCSHDILVARSSLVRTADNKVHLRFSHLLSRFDVHLQFIEHYTDVSNISVTADVISSAEINLLDGTSTCGSSHTLMPLDKIEALAGADWSGSQIIIPQQLTDCAMTINFTSNGIEYHLTYAHPSLLFEQGNRTTLTLLVSKDDVKAGGVTVSQWGYTPPLGEAEAEEKE